MSELAMVADLAGDDVTETIVACEGAAQAAQPAAPARPQEHDAPADASGESFTERFKVMFRGMRFVPRSDVLTGTKSLLEHKAAASEAASSAASVPVDAAKEEAGEAARGALARATSELKEWVIARVAEKVELRQEEVVSILVEAVGDQILTSVVGEIVSAAGAVAPVVRTAKGAAMAAASGGHAGWKKYKQTTVRKRTTRLQAGPPQAALRCVSRLVGRMATQKEIDALRHGTSLATSIPADLFTVLGIAGLPFSLGGSAVIIPFSEALGYAGSAAEAVAGLIQKLCVMVRDVSEVRRANYYLAHPDDVTDEGIFEQCPYLGLWWLLLASDGELASLQIDTASTVHGYGRMARIRNCVMRRRDWMQTNAFAWAEHRNAVRTAANSLLLSYDYVLVRETAPTSAAAAAHGASTVMPVKAPVKPEWDDYVFTIWPRAMNLTRMAAARLSRMMNALSADSAEAMLQGMVDCGLTLEPSA
jgi:hypothetical protein